MLSAHLQAQTEHLAQTLWDTYRLHMHPYFKNGDTVELVIKDDKNDPAASRSALKSLITEKNVSAIRLLSIKESARAVTELADEYQVPVFAVPASDSEIAKGKSYVCQLNSGENLSKQVEQLQLMSRRPTM